MISRLKLNFSFSLELVIKLSTLLVFLFGVSTNAGINVVGNGGGWAELQFIYQFKNSDAYVSLLVKQNSLGLQTYLSALEKLQTDFKKQNQFQITFDSNLPSDFKTQEKHLFVNNKVLYIDEAHPKKIHEIAVAVIYSQLMMIGFDFPQKKFYEDFSRIFDHLKVDEFGYISSFDSSLIKINDLSYQFDFGFQSRLLALEDAKRSYEINDLVEQQLPCGEISDWNFNQWTSDKYYDQRSFYADATAICAGIPQSYRILIGFKVDETTLIDSTSIQVGFY